MTSREISPEARSTIREAITNAYYEARNAGQTMEQAADRAVENLLPVIASIDENAHQRGRAIGALEAYWEVMLERTDEEEPFVAGLRDAAQARVDAIQ